MNIAKLTLITSALLSAATYSYAQDDEAAKSNAVEISAGVKTYYPEKLGYLPNALISDVIQFIRVNGHYGLMINGENYNDNTFLGKTTVSDVECIQIISNSAQCGRNIGLDGNINIILKNKAEGFHGRAEYSIDTRANMTPKVQLSYKKNNLTLWGGVMSAIRDTKLTENDYSYKKIENTYSSTQTSNIVVVNGKTTSETKYKPVTANFGLEYNTGKDIFTFNISENWVKPKTTISYDNSRLSSITEKTSILESDITDTKSTNIYNNLFADAHYTHEFSSKCSISANISEEFHNQPQWIYTNNDHAEYYIDNSTKPASSDLMSKRNNYSTEAYYNHGSNTYLDVHVDLKPAKILSIKTGIWGNMYFSNQESGRSGNEIAWERHYSPYVNASVNLKKWSFNIDVRGDISGINYTLKEAARSESLKAKADTNHLMVSAGVVWRPNLHHSVIASYSQRGGTNFERLWEDITYTRNIIEIPLCNSFNVFDLEYAYSGKTISAGANFRYYDFDTYSLTFAPIYIATDYITNLKSRVHLSAYAAAHFGCFSINARANYNIFNNNKGDITYKSSSEYRTTYWDVTLNPVVSLPKDFTLSATAVYYGKEKHPSFDVDSHMWLSLRAAKQWNRFTAFVQWENIINGDIKSHSDVTEATMNYKSYSTTRNTLNQNQNTVTFGGSFKF